ncbi:hypothetical protein [Pseudomonas sp. Leaf434]|uniref:hypothetical protein n=1 Tax=Pseudomonas sp. Leaf434 TaxID=1736376 RepID=UPI0006F251BD|nr:hypothetical protein [Pseudomonas sp. Leaf434]KQT67861.1 hypothetical protein ASG55_08275 [Pseudomonas sp. Leaf434]
MTDIPEDAQIEEAEESVAKTKDFVRFLIAKRSDDYKCSQCGANTWSIHNESGLALDKPSGDGLNGESPVIEFEHDIRNYELAGITYGIHCSNCGFIVFTLASIVNNWVKENPADEVHEE